MCDRKFYKILLLLKAVVLLGGIIGYGECYKIGNDPNKRGAVLERQGRYRVTWEVDRRGTGRINFNATVWTNGWVLFGFANDGGEQTGRDVVVGGVRENGQAYFSVRFLQNFSNLFKFMFEFLVLQNVLKSFLFEFVIVRNVIKSFIYFTF